MLKHLLLKHSIAKTMLIVALHASVTFDAWSTNRDFGSAMPPYSKTYEVNPIMRPFAGTPAEYPVLNSLYLPLDFMILRAKSKKMKVVMFAAALAFTAVEVRQGVKNMQVHNQIWDQYCYGLWTDGRGGCNANGKPLK
jgi:hypothetical protein